MPDEEEMHFMCLVEDDLTAPVENLLFDVDLGNGDFKGRKVNGQVSPEMAAVARGPGRALVQRAFAGNGKVWRKSETVAGNVAGPLVLSIAFVDGSADQRRITLDIAREWCGPNGANITMVEAPVDRSDIRVTFATRNNHSAVGSDAAAAVFAAPKATMHLGDAQLVSGTPPPRMLRVVRHEFGHALGLSHEHQHPEAPFVFDFDRVVDAHNGLEWGGCAISRARCEESVRTNITNRFTEAQVQFVSAEFDDDSVMLYPLRDAWLLSGGPARQNTAISSVDLAVARAMYP